MSVGEYGTYWIRLVIVLPVVTRPLHSERAASGVASLDIIVINCILLHVILYSLDTKMHAVGLIFTRKLQDNMFLFCAQSFKTVTETTVYFTSYI